MLLPIRYWKLVLIAMFFMFTTNSLAQDLDPRAYLWLPKKTNTAVTGFSYSHGGVVTDPTLPIQDLEASVQVTTLGYVNTFNFFGLTSHALAVVPYSWAQVSGKVINQPQEITRAGFADTRLRLTVLVLGGPSIGLEEFVKAQKKTILGISMSVVAPTGEFFSDKLINLGTHRWSFKPEVALSQPISKRWLIDVYAGVWLFTANHSFYPGNSVRTQRPMSTLQAHLSYNIRPRLWIALDGTFYAGGKSSIDDTYNDDRQNNSRVGVTTVMPIGKSNSLKLAFSTGAVVRVGQDFTTVSVGWQHSWFGKTEKKSL